MENEQPSQFGKETTGETQADKEWTDFQRDLDTLGRQLAELQAHTASLGRDLVSALQARFDEVKIRAEEFRRARERELEQLRQTAAKQAEGTFSEARARSAETARQMWERAEPLRQGAKDVGEGLVRAWGELRASFGKAAGRLHSEQKPSANGPAPASIEQPRDS
jgi:cell division septum initiation protein DivIVA